MSFFHNLHLPRRLAALIVCVVFAAGALLGLLSATVRAQEVEPSSTQRADINEMLAADLAQATAPVSFLVVLRDQPDPAVLLAGAGVQAAAAQARRAELYRALTAHAERTQAPLRAWLDARGVRYTPHYLVNMIEVQGDQALADQLRLRPEVDRLARNPAVRQTEALPASRFGEHPAALAAALRTAVRRCAATIGPAVDRYNGCCAYSAAVWPDLHGGRQGLGIGDSWPRGRRRQPGYRG